MTSEIQILSVHCINTEGRKLLSLHTAEQLWVIIIPRRLVFSRIKVLSLAHQGFLEFGKDAFTFLQLWKLFTARQD